jgi:integrase
LKKLVFFPAVSSTLATRENSLTGQRRSEIAATTLEWINDNTITIPASITKNKRPHTIPLTPLARSFLPINGFSGWSKAKARIDRHVDIPHWTIHDLRRTFSTINAQLGTPIHVTEKILNHVSGTRSSIQQVYDQHTYLPEMRTALETYEAHLATINAPRA